MDCQFFRRYLQHSAQLIDGSVLSTRFRPSPISSGGLEILLMMTFKNQKYITHQKMKNFMTKLCYDHKPATKCRIGSG